MSEYPLRGGSVNTVVRAGDTVRRRPAGRFVHELLGFFERSGWGGAPRFLGVDERGREILSFVDGYVPWRSADVSGVTAEASLVRVAELVREFHDLTTGTPLAGDDEVVCHNDLAPNNTVYSRGGRTGAGAASRPPPRPVIRPWSGCATTVPCARCGPPSGGWLRIALNWRVHEIRVRAGAG